MLPEMAERDFTIEILASQQPHGVKDSLSDFKMKDGKEEMAALCRGRA